MSYQGGPYWQYPPSAPPPPPPQPPRRNSRWPAFATERGIRLYILAPLLAVLLIVLLAVGVSAARQRILAQSQPPQPTLAPYPTVTAYPTGTATTPPTATATMAPVAPAVLGATEDAFTAAFGNPEMRGPVPWYTFTTSDGTMLQLCVCDLTAGTDGQPHADILSFGLAGSSANLSTDQWVALARTFAPTDAVYVNDIHDPDVGTLHIYRSATLAAIFPAGDVANTGPSGGLVPPGTFNINCDNPAVTGCALRVGT